MIRAIIFDCFGVLTSDGWLPFKKKHFGHNQELFDEASDLNAQTGSGMMSNNEFMTRIADMARVSVGNVARQILGSHTNEELFEYIAGELKPTYQIGMLSNAGSNALNDMFTPEQVKVFDTVVLSYEIGAVKPNKEAYENILDKMNIQPDEAVFIDDQLRHCTGARDAGMKAIVYKDFDQMKTELEKLIK